MVPNFKRNQGRYNPIFSKVLNPKKISGRPDKLDNWATIGHWHTNIQNGSARPSVWQASRHQTFLYRVLMTYTEKT